MNKIKQNLILLIIIGTLISCKNNDNTIVEPSTEKAIEKSDTFEQVIPKEELDKNEQKIYEQFKINSSLNGNSIDVSISTDLPDVIEVSFSISRSYWEKGDPESEYSEDYYSEYITVGQLKKTQTIALKKQTWQSNLTDNQKKMSASGLGFDVEKISDSIKVYAVVMSSNGIDPTFKDGKIGQNEIMLYYPMKGNIETQSKYGNFQSLEIGKTYSVSKTTPLMPQLNPADPIAAVGKMKELVTDNRIKILNIVNKRNTPWYEVKAFDKNSKSIGVGWINSMALIGQELRVIK